MMPGAERIAVTGVGLTTALGLGARMTFERLLAGERGLSEVTLFPVEGQRSVRAAQIHELPIRDIVPRGREEAWSRTDVLAAHAAKEALAEAGFDARQGRLSVVVGGSTGGMYEAEHVLASLRRGSAHDESVKRLLAYPLSATLERLAELFGSIRRGVTVCSACSSGAVALVQAVEWLRAGATDAVLAGGTDGLCLLTFTGFNSLGATDPDPDGCRPFDRDRAGLTLGEGAGFLVLEREGGARSRGAAVLGFLSGWAIGAEAFHITHPEPTGATAARLIAQALESAGLAPSDIDYVNAHGTGTEHNDAMEGRALCAALGDESARIRVSSSKGQLGHTLAAAGAIEAAVTVLALHDGRVPPTGGLSVPDPTIELAHVLGRGERIDPRAALSNSFGFGGTGCVLAFERADAPVRARPSPAPPRLVISGQCAIGSRGIAEGEGCAAYADAGGAVERPNPLAELDAGRSRRFDEGAALVTLGVERAVQNAGLRASTLGLVAGNAFGNVERSVGFLERVIERGPRLASPAEFPHLVPSAAAGNASIYAGVTGPVVSVADLSGSAEAAVGVAMSLIALGLAPAVVAGSAEPADVIVERVLGPMHGVDAPRASATAWIVLEERNGAMARGHRPLADVLAAEVCWIDGVEPRVPRRRGSGAACVVSGVPSATLDAELHRAGWADARRIDPLGACRSPEAVGGFALVVAASLIAAGRCAEALVCGASRTQLYFTHLGRHDDRLGG